METPRSIFRAPQQGQWLTSLDLKDVCFHIGSTQQTDAVLSQRHLLAVHSTVIRVVNQSESISKILKPVLAIAHLHRVKISCSYLGRTDPRNWQYRSHPFGRRRLGKWTILSWNGLYAYAYPPTSLIRACLNKVRTENVEIVLIAPGWPNQEEFPDLLDLPLDFPITLPPVQKLLKQIFSCQRRVVPCQAINPVKATVQQ